MSISGVKLKIIVIDDDGEWGNLIKMLAESLGYCVDCVKNFGEAKMMIKNAHDTNERYTVATIDRNFKIGEDGFKAELGLEMLKYIKNDYQYIACIMVSGSSVTPDEVLDLRDILNLDYYLRKDLIGPDVLKKAIERATNRTRPQKPEDRIRLLKDSRDTLRNISEQIQNNLFHATERAAKKGLDVDPTTRNEITQYEIDLKKTWGQLNSIEDEITKIERTYSIF